MCEAPVAAATATYTVHQLEVFNRLVQPVWVMDFLQARRRWINRAGLEMWNSPCVDEFCSRDMERSSATMKKLEQIQATLEQGKSTSAHWTFYPKGVPKLFHVTFTGIRLLDSSHSDHICILFHAVPEDTESLAAKSLRGGEMLRHLPMPVCQFDMEGNVMFENQWAVLPEQKVPEEKNTGNNTTATDFTSRFVNPKVAQEAMSTIQSPGSSEVIQLEAELYSTKNPGRTEWSQVNLRRTTDPVTGKTVVLYNAIDKSDAQTAIREKEARVQKSEFLAIMAHEIRTPLHQVTGYIDLLAQTTALTPEQRGYVDTLQTSAEGLMTVISDVLDYSKLEAGQLKIETIPYEPLRVVEGSMEAVKARCDTKGLQLKIHCASGSAIPFRIMGDPNRVRQVLLNFLSNAIKFTKPAGEIRIEARTIHKDDPELQYYISNCQIRMGRQDLERNHERYIQFTVSDTGMGISKEHQKLVFEKYNQGNLSSARQFGGTGLGLSICSILVQSMGGFIGVTSQLGMGSDFWFLLPLTVPIEKCTLTKSNTNGVLPPGLNGGLETTEENDSGYEEISLNILVAEDNKINQKLICNMLKRLGHRTTIAENGQQAVELAQDARSSFSCVLMDIQMPVMDGLEATRRLRTLGHVDLPIFGLTASVKQHNYKELGFDDWLAKPVRLNVLRDKLFQVMEGKLLHQDVRIQQ